MKTCFNNKCNNELTRPTQKKFCSRICSQTNPITEETREKLKTNRHSPETIEKIRKGNLGVKRSKETCEKIRQIALQREMSDETKEKLRQIALGRPQSLETREKRSITMAGKCNFRKRPVEYRGIMLDSSWELALAVRLDELNIKWSRPSESFIWYDKNKQKRRYTADFFLPDYNLYLDPKNSFVIKQNKDKIDYIMKNYDNIVIIKTLKECQEYIPPTYNIT